MGDALTNRGLLRAALIVFGLFLAYRFLAAVAASALLLATGLLLAVALSGPTEFLHRRKVPRAVAAIGVFLGVVGVTVLGAYLLLPTLTTQVYQLVDTLPGAVAQLVERSREQLNDLGVRVGGGDLLSTSTLTDVARRVAGGAVGLFGGLASSLLGVVVVVFVALYLAAVPEPVVGWVARLFPPDRREGARALGDELRGQLLGWLAGRLISMVIVGALSTAALYVIGVPAALFLGILTGLLSFVPLIGPIISAVPPLVLSLAGNPVDALWVVLAYVAIQQVESNLLTPLVMEQVASVHPVVVISAVTVFGAAFGILGALLAVPTAVVAGVLVEELWVRRLEEGESRLAAGENADGT